MINNDLLFILLFWGTWLLIPVVTDGAVTLWYLLMSFSTLLDKTPPPLPKKGLTKVSILIPAYNEQLNINYCIMSLKAQTYPQHLLEIIVVDDGSEDHTPDLVLEHMGPYNGDGNSRYLRTSSFTIGTQDFGGVLNLVRRKRDGATIHGKPAAVNAALALATGDLIVAIDSDVVLEPHAVENAVRAFLADDSMIAATGHLVVDPYLSFENDATGRAHADEAGMPVVKPLSLNENLLAACQFLEYSTAFHLGRRSESRFDGLFTLSGACAVFRRSAFEVTGGYRGRTVSEDTDMTMALHRIPGEHVGYLPNMEVHLAPVLSWSSLYAQRTRWQRGALEVSAVHMMAKYQQCGKRMFWNVILPLRLQVDHTLALPRLIWTFLIFMLPLFGYSTDLISQALGLMFVFYLAVNFVRVLVTYAFSTPPEKVLIRRYLGYTLALPVYTMFLFWTRLSASLRTLTEDATWTVHNTLLEDLESFDMRYAIARVATMLHEFL